MCVTTRDLFLRGTQIHSRAPPRKAVVSRGKMAAAVTGAAERAESEITTCSPQPACTAAPHREALSAEDFLEDRDTELMCPRTVGELMEHLTEQNNTLKEQVTETARRASFTQKHEECVRRARCVTNTVTAVNGRECVGNVAAQPPS